MNKKGEQFNFYLYNPWKFFNMATVVDYLVHSKKYLSFHITNSTQIKIKKNQKKKKGDWLWVRKNEKIYGT